MIFLLIPRLLGRCLMVFEILILFLDLGASGYFSTEYIMHYDDQDDKFWYYAEIGLSGLELVCLFSCLVFFIICVMKLVKWLTSMGVSRKTPLSLNDALQ